MIDRLYLFIDLFFEIVFWYGCASYTIVFLALIFTDYEQNDNYSRILGTLAFIASIAWMWTA